MPPKKRVRDVDDEELDKEEVKGMLRQSLDERAELVVKNEELQKNHDAKVKEMTKDSDAKLTEMEKKLEANKKELAAERKEHEKEKDRQLIEKVQLFAVDAPVARRSRFVYYRNPHLLRQATVANMKSVLDIQWRSGVPCGKEKIFVLKVESCQELVQIFENGIPVGTELETEGHFDHKKVLFSVVVITHKTSPSTVAEGQQTTYLPVSARSYWGRFNYPLAHHLEQSAPFPQELYPRTNLHKNLKLYFSHEVQTLVKTAAYDAVIDNVWIPKSGEEDVALKHQLDLNKMLLIRGDTSVEIGFTHGELPNGTKFQPRGRGSGVVG